MECCVASGFRSDADEMCALLGYYAAYGGNSLQTFRDNLSGPIFKDQTDPLKVETIVVPTHPRYR